MSTLPTVFRAVIVDDEPLAREAMVNAIRRLAVPIEIASVCENAVVALETIKSLEPDILLLDVAMPVLDGFAMLERLEPEATPPAIVFITAYDEHAVQAFAAEALDFLVKPVSDERLRASLERAMRRINEVRTLRAGLEHASALGAQPLRAYLSQLLIPERGRELVVPVDDIEWIEGDTYYVRVHCRTGTRLLRERLSKLEQALDPSRFHRTHRSAIVRVDLIRELRAATPYTYLAILASGARAPVSRERVSSLRERLAHRNSKRD